MEPRYWAFVANPKTYRVQNSLLGREANWTVKKADVRKGDRVLIWKAKGHESDRGIVALADVVSDPIEMSDTGDKHWVDAEDARRIERRVHVRYDVPVALPLWESADSFLSTLSVARATGGTVFKITPSQWQRILDRCGVSR